MINIVRTNSKNEDFIKLVKRLDVYLAQKDGEEHSFYAQFNKIESIKYVVLVYDNERAIACGGIKDYEPDVIEVKRMYTDPKNRGKGIASKILIELENWALELGYKTCILETGKKQMEAIKFYHKSGYNLIPNYGQYANVENSLCFEKRIFINK